MRCVGVSRRIWPGGLWQDREHPVNTMPGRKKVERTVAVTVLSTPHQAPHALWGRESAALLARDM